jgi:hypothetical protein
VFQGFQGFQGALALNPVAAKTANYSANAGELVPVNASGGSFTVTLPTAPADKTLVALVVTAAPGANTVTIATGGSDVINQAGSVTDTIRIGGQAKVYQYQLSTATWFRWSNTPENALLAYIMTAANVETTFGAAGQLYLGTGAGTGTLLSIGSAAQILTVSGGTAVWAAPVNQVTAANIEATFAASGQLYVGTGSGTGTLLAAGASGTVLEGGTTPAWGVLPGTVLATQQFAPSTLSTYAAAATTMTALDTTNLTLSFTVPANGIVDVLVQITYTIVGTVGGATLYLCLLNHTGGALLGNVQMLAVNGGTSITLQAVNTVTFHLTGLTPGALQIDVAGGKIDASGTATGNFYAIANTSKTIASDTAAGPCIIQAIASV